MSADDHGDVLGRFDPLRAASELRSMIVNGAPSLFAENAALKAKLDWLLHELEQQSDVRDRSDGTQEANQAMSILAEYGERFR